MVKTSLDWLEPVSNGFSQPKVVRASTDWPEPVKTG